MKTATAILALVAGAGAAVGAPPAGTFDDPVIIMQGDRPLNADGKLMYPSPAIFDVDGDGADELVLGTIMGDVFKCENSATHPNEPLWGKPIAMKTHDGELMKLNNW